MVATSSAAVATDRSEKRSIRHLKKSCRLRVDQGLSSLVGLLQADVTGKPSGDDE